MSHISIYSPGEVAPIDKASNSLTMPTLKQALKEKVISVLQPSPERRLEEMKIYRQMLEEQNAIIQLKTRNGRAAEVAHFNVLTELDEARRSLPSTEDLRRMEEVKEADHRYHLTIREVETRRLKDNAEQEVLDAIAARLIKLASVKGVSVNESQALTTAILAQRVMDAEKLMKQDPTKVAHSLAYQTSHSELAQAAKVFGKSASDVLKEARKAA